MGLLPEPRTFPGLRVDDRVDSAGVTCLESVILVLHVLISLSFTQIKESLIWEKSAFPMSICSLRFDFVKVLVICHIFWAFNSSGFQGIPEENITFSSQSAYLSFCLSPPGPCPLTCPWGLCSSLLNLSGKRNQFYLVYLLFHLFLLEIWISLTLWYCLNMFFFFFLIFMALCNPDYYSSCGFAAFRSILTG